MLFKKKYRSEELPNGDTNVYAHFKRFWPQWLTRKPRQFPYVYRFNQPRALMVRAHRDGKAVATMDIVPETLSPQMREIRLDSLEDDLRANFDSEFQLLSSHDG